MQPETLLNFSASMLNLHSRMGLELDEPSRCLLAMIRKEGGYRTAVILVRREKPSRRFHRLSDQGRLDLSVEALILQPQWNGLFSLAVRIIAYRRLVEHGYLPPSCSWTPWHLFKSWSEPALLLAA